MRIQIIARSKNLPCVRQAVDNRGISAAQRDEFMPHNSGEALVVEVRLGL